MVLHPSPSRDTQQSLFLMNKSSPAIIPVLALCSHLSYCQYLCLHVAMGTSLVPFSHQPQTAITSIMQSTGHIATLHTVQPIPIVCTSTNNQYMMTITWPHWHASLGTSMASNPFGPSSNIYLLPLHTATLKALQYYLYSNSSSPSPYSTPNWHCVDPPSPTTPDKNLLWPP